MTDVEMHDDAGRTEALVTVGGGSEPDPMDAADEWAAAQASARGRKQAMPVDPELVDDESAEIDTQHQDLLPESPVRMAPDVEDRGADDDSADGETGFDDDRIADEHPATDERLTADQHAADDHPAAEAVPDEVDEQEWADHVAAAPAGSYEVSDEQLRPVPRRPGRGGFDPEAAEATRAYRYQQRRRVTLILAVSAGLSTVASLLLVNWLWFGAAISLALLVGYLTYLRRQVRIEAAIRQKRMERVQRARQIRPEYGRRPQRARAGMSVVAPGRTVVDLDDDDPGFDDLEEFHQPMTYRRAAGQ